MLGGRAMNICRWKSIWEEVTLSGEWALRSFGARTLDDAEHHKLYHQIGLMRLLTASAAMSMLESTPVDDRAHRSPDAADVAHRCYQKDSCPSTKYA